MSNIFGNSTPAVSDSGDTAEVTLGVAFRSDVAGNVTGIRFYKDPNNVGPHIGTLWSSGGSKLATVNFTGESASGWQQMSFASAVAITANTIYIASYHAAAPSHFSYTAHQFDSAVDNAPLHAVAAGEHANGLFDYTVGDTFPTSSFNNTNYWADLMFTASGTAMPLAADGLAASSGTADVVVKRVLAAAGMASSAGGADIVVQRVLTAQGMASSSGAATIAVQTALAANGLAASGGSATLNLRLALVAAGMASSSGTAAFPVTGPPYVPGPTAARRIA